MKSFSFVKSFLKRGRVHKKYLLFCVLLTIFPVGILTSYYYPSVRKVTSDNLYAANEQTVSQIQINMDTQLNDIFNLPYMINNHRNLLRFDLENNELARYKAKYEIYNLTRSNTILTVMYLYIQRIKHFIAPTGYGSFKLSQIQTSPFVYGTGFTINNEETDLDLYLSSLEMNTVLKLQNAQIESTIYPEMLCFILPLSSSNNFGDVIAFVDCQELKNLSGNLESTAQQVLASCFNVSDAKADIKREHDEDICDNVKEAFAEPEIVLGLAEKKANPGLYLEDTIKSVRKTCMDENGKIHECLSAKILNDYPIHFMEYLINNQDKMHPSPQMQATFDKDMYDLKLYLNKLKQHIA